MSLVLERKGVDARKGKSVRQFEIWLGDLGNRNGSVQRGVRPLLIMSNNRGNAYGPTVIVIPLTSQKLNRKMPTHVLFKAEDVGLLSDSVALFEQITTIDKSDLHDKVAEVPVWQYKEIASAYEIACKILF